MITNSIPIEKVLEHLDNISHQHSTFSFHRMSTGAQGERESFEFGEDNRSVGYDQANGGVVTVSSLISRGTVCTPARFHAAFETAIWTPARFTFYRGPLAADRRNLLPTCPFLLPLSVLVHDTFA